MPAPSPEPHPEPHPRLDELIATLELLRAPGGCAWDREQTHGSLVQYLTEESAELVEAIEAGGDDELVEELGDVLYQVLFHADIAREAGRFTIEDVAERSARKMVGRHPHVFGDGSVTAETADAVAGNWDAWKAAEKPTRSSVLDGVPEGMPALALADKVLGRAAKVGVDVPRVAGPDDESELGEMLLGVVADARSRGLDAERALRAAVRGVRERVRAAE